MTNFKNQMTKEIPKSNGKKVYDLEERTALFGEQIFKLRNLDLI